MTRAQLSQRVIFIGKLAVATLSAIRLLPHIAVLTSSPNRKLLWADLDVFGKRCDKGLPLDATDRILLFIRMMTFVPEYRNVFYFRHPSLGYFLGFLCWPKDSLKIDVKTCGPGLFIQHGFGTLIFAEEIGADCSIGQLVSIDYIDNPDERPKIGNRVTVGAGARVLGGVTVGDNVFISANSLVTQDVPAGVTVIGVPAKIVFSRPSA